MPGDFISRAAAINKIMENIVHQDSHDTNLHNIGLRKAMSAIDSLPAADVVKAGEAEWRYQTMTVPGGKGQTYAKWSCSACKGKQKKRSRYCPDCGKRMKNGGQDDG